MLGNNIRDQHIRTYDTLVIGAGIVGAACARRLSRAGHRVLVLEAGYPGQQATAACMGHVVVMDDSPAQLALTRYSRELWAEILPQLPKDCEAEETGTLWVAAGDEEMAGLEPKAGLYRKAGVACEILDSKDVYRREPNLGPGLLGALRVPGDQVVYPTNCTRWFLEGIEVLTGREVVALEPHVAVDSGGNRYEADNIVVAGGGLARNLIPELPVSPRKGHLVITDRCPGFVNHQVVELGYLSSAHKMENESVAFNVQPRSTGQVLLGSSREFCGWDKTVNHELLQKMTARALLYMPALSALNVIRVWTGFRPCTPDKLPLVGKWPPLEDVYVAAGHEGLGITTSLGTAEAVASQILNVSCPFDASPLNPGRVLEEKAS